MCDTVFSDRFKDLRDATGRPSLAYQTQSLVQGVDTPEEQKTQEEKWEAEGGHPQKRMMRTIDDLEDRAVLCFDCGEDMQPAHFGEMSCPLAYAHGCRSTLLAGNCRDTQTSWKCPISQCFRWLDHH